MRRKPILAAAAAAGLVLAILATPAGGQVSKDPAISARQFKSGSAKVTVAGSFQIDQDVAINSAASIGDGDFTWLQFGVSGSDEPNALITFGDGEGGITIGRGKRIATIDRADCSGKLDVTAASVSGHYTCTGVTSYDPGTGKMGKVDIAVRFAAKS